MSAGLELRGARTGDTTLPGTGLAPGWVPAQRAGAQGTRVRRQLPDLRGAALLVGLLVLAGVVHWWGMGRSPGMMDDEGTYVAQAWALLERGALSHYTYWYDHPPLGSVQLAGWFGLTGGFDRGALAVARGRELMLVAHLVSVALLFVLSRRLGLSRLAAAGAVLVFTLSPLSLAMGRMVLLDNLALAWLLAALVLAASPKRWLWAYAGSGACAAIAVLTKETFLLLVPMVVWLAWTRADPRTRRFCIAAFFAVFVLIAASYPLFALLKGELVPTADRVSLFDAIRFQLFDRPSSGSVLDAASGARATVDGWLTLDPWLLIGGLVALPAGFMIRPLRPIAFGYALLALLPLRGGYLPGPYVVAMLPLAALLVAGGIDHLWHERHALGRRAADGSRVARASTSAGIVVVLFLVLFGAAVVAPAWASGDKALLGADRVTPVRETIAWLEDHHTAKTTVVVDDTLWVDLVERGYASDQVIWFQKLDFTQNIDPSVTRRFPDGWRQLDYVVSTPVLRDTVRSFPDGMTDVRAAIRNSRLVARFGEGTDRVEVRRVVAPER